jgi:hypothetical protein
VTDWSDNWIWGFPLILLTVLVHVFGLLLIRERIVLRIHAAIGGGHDYKLSAGAVGISVLLVTVMHALESAVWALAYFMLGALPDMHEAMLYSLSAMTAYGHETFHLTWHWQMMGALEALNGLMLFGLTTAFLFAVIQAVWPALAARRH